MVRHHYHQHCASVLALRFWQADHRGLRHSCLLPHREPQLPGWDELRLFDLLQPDNPRDYEPLLSLWLQRQRHILLSVHRRLPLLRAGNPQRPLVPKHIDHQNETDLFMRPAENSPRVEMRH